MNYQIKQAILISAAAISAIALVGCSSSSSDSPSDSNTIDNPIGTFTINTSGGLGGSDGGIGGNGQSVSLSKTSGIGNAEVLASGQADASFEVITPSANLGENPLEITADTTIVVATEEPSTGTPYLTTSNSYLRISDGNGTLNDETPVTGLSIATDTTLTFDLNYTNYASLRLNNDILNSGTITTSDNIDSSRGSLQINSSSYVGTSSSSITTAGSTDGQNAGYINLYTNYSIYNHGNIHAWGGDGITGAAGQGGAVDLTAQFNIQNSATIDNHGGDSSTGAGGSAADINIGTGYGTINLSGSLISYGGSGASAGNGGNFEFYNEGSGSILTSTYMDTHGGSSSNGNGGQGGQIELGAYGGELINSGDMLTAGGNTTEASMDAGDGGNVYFYSSTGYAYPDEAGPLPAGSILISGNINTSGGNAMASGSGTGGDGGNISAEISSYSYPSDSRLAFLGYTSIDTSGGDGNYGGNANAFVVNNNSSRLPGGTYLPSGNIVNEADLIASGGNAVSTSTTFPATAGNGGSFILETGYSYGFLNPALEKTSNNGNINLSSGDSFDSTSSASSGYTWLWGYNGVTNTGSIIATGGDDLGTDGGTTGYGSRANNIEIYTNLGAVINEAPLNVSGGNGEYRGGDASSIDIYGTTINNTANLVANGGHSDNTLAGSRGGYGGYIELASPDGIQAITHTGTVSVASGDGETSGIDGTFISGGMCVSGCSVAEKLPVIK